LQEQKDQPNLITQEQSKPSGSDQPAERTRRSGRPKVVILGAGFGGLWAAKTLAKKPVDVEVIDRNNYHTFFPLLYQVGAAELAPVDIVYPLRHIFRRMPNVSFNLGSVTQIDFAARQVFVGSEPVDYDYLIIGLGSRPFYFNIPGADQFAFPLKSLDQAVALRNQVLYLLEKASRESDAQVRRSLLTFAIIGGGPTGVEFAGTMAELINHSVPRDFPTLDIREARVALIEADESLLNGFPSSLSDYTKARLEKMGIEMHLNSRVVEIGSDTVCFQDGSVLPASTVIWTAGVQGFSGVKQWGLPTARNGQVEVLPTLQAPEHGEVYVVGDLARYVENDKPLPMVAQVAIQQGQAAARNILRALRGEEQQPFHYRDKGSLAVIGRNSAVAQIWGRSFTGFIAWVIWLAVHIFYLIGFRNRIQVMASWAVDYFSSDRPVELIVPSRPE
jgi:NADH dehydrogenase